MWSAKSSPTCAPAANRTFPDWAVSGTTRKERWSSSPPRGAAMTEPSPVHQLTRIVLRSLAQGKAVEIDGLGTFYPDSRAGVRFEAAALPQVYLAYVREDQALAERLYETVAAAGFSPWMDVRKLLPGQNWPRAIDAAIENSD